MSQPAPSDAARRERPHRIFHLEGLLPRLFVAGLYLLLTEQLTIGPTWLMLALVVIFFVPIHVARWRGAYRLTRRLGLLFAALSAAMVVLSTVGLVREVTSGAIPAPHLLLYGTVLWVANGRARHAATPRAIWRRE